MKQLLVISLLVVSLAAVLVAANCGDCKGKGKECVNGECRCKSHYFTSKATGECTATCDSMTTDFVMYESSMMEQGLSYWKDTLDDASGDEASCRETCSQTADCVGFAVKRNELSDRGKCFFFKAEGVDEIKSKWRGHKGRWDYYARMCQ